MIPNIVSLSLTFFFTVIYDLFITINRNKEILKGYFTTVLFSQEYLKHLKVLTLVASITTR